MVRPVANLLISYLTHHEARIIYRICLKILKCIWEGGVHVLGAIAWSVFDNWEFGSYNSQIEIQKVNRTTLERYYKKGFFDLVDFMGARNGLGY